MVEVDLQQLVQALDPASRQQMEMAAERCIQRGGSRILPEDLLLVWLDGPAEGLLPRALADAGVAAEALRGLLQPRGEPGESRSPVFAPELVQWLQDALMTASLRLGRPQIDEAALLLSLVEQPLRYVGSRPAALLGNIRQARLQDFIASRQQQPASARDGESALCRFTHNYTLQAREGRLDPVLCRGDAIGQMIDILARRRKNNPIVVGEAGVGKTALVEGLALRIAAGDVPPALHGVELLALDMGLLQAGASVKGEFERRLQGVIDEVRNSPVPVILFIDEAHTLIGAGAQAGGSDAANLLKPALARGELRTIAATTWSEYKKYFEKDPALARRFQPVRLLEPTVSEAVSILRGLAPVYRQSHGVYLRDDAVQAAAELSARYLAGRQLPDKAVDVLDTACARVRISLAAPPRALEQLRDQLAEQQRQLDALQQDQAAGVLLDDTVLDRLIASLSQLQEQEQELAAAWQQQRTLAARLLELRQQADGSGAGLEDLQAELDALQAQQRLVSHEVCPRLVAEVISQWTGVPLSQLAREHNDKVTAFAGELRQRVRGQEQAVQALDRNIRAAAAGLNNPQAPTGVFLLVGPSGVGKTETALALADLLYGGERFLTVINMSEFQERHSISRLIGSPPGYVGYGEGGMLTEAVRQKPYSVVLLDEVEKADPEVLNLFYQIFDKGVANDGEGREIDFRNCLILLTSNLASAQISQLCAGGQRPEAETLLQHIRPTLSQHFKPALLGRMRVVPYYPVEGELLRELIDLKLQRFGQRLAQRQLTFDFSPALVDELMARCTHSESGARLIDQLLEQLLLPQVADRLLDGMASGQVPRRVHATLDSQQAVICEFA